MRQPLLVLQLGGPELFLELFVVLKFSQALQKSQIFQPGVASKSLRGKLAERGIALIEPSTRCDTVGDVAEFCYTVEVDKVFEDSGLLWREGTNCDELRLNPLL